jgi:hypothetical protein
METESFRAHEHNFHASRSKLIGVGSIFRTSSEGISRVQFPGVCASDRLRFECQNDTFEKAIDMGQLSSLRSFGISSKGGNYAKLELGIGSAALPKHTILGEVELPTVGWFPGIQKSTDLD